VQGAWLPALQQHANTARRLRCVEVLAQEPANAAAELSELIGIPGDRYGRLKSVPHLEADPVNGPPYRRRADLSSAGLNCLV
jgi:hypothetical protein